MALRPDPRSHELKRDRSSAVAVPVACRLSAQAGTERLEEWRKALARTVAQAIRPRPGQLRLRLDAGASDIASIVLLAREEKACCPFFGFAFEVGASSVDFLVEV